jgi:hypothetical protein
LTLLPSKNIEGKSIYSYSLSPSLSLPPLLEGSMLIKYIEEAHRGKEAHRGREGRKHTEGRKHIEGEKYIEGRKVEVE